QPKSIADKKPSNKNETIEILTSDGQRTRRLPEKNKTPDSATAVQLKDSLENRKTIDTFIKRGTIEKTILPVVEKDSVAVNKRNDTVSKKKVDLTLVKDQKTKKDSSVKRPMVYSTGLGLYQQIPVAGQKWVPYSSTGRKTSLADYIPSIYFRAEKQGRWFLQSEFRYGAPQQTKEFIFRKDVKTDTGSAHFTKTN